MIAFGARDGGTGAPQSPSRMWSGSTSVDDATPAPPRSGFTGRGLEHVVAVGIHLVGRREMAPAFDGRVEGPKLTTPAPPAQGMPFRPTERNGIESYASDGPPPENAKEKP